VFKNNGRSPAFIDGLVFKFIDTSALPAVPDWSFCVNKLGAPGAELFCSAGSHYDVYEGGASFADDGDRLPPPQRQDRSPKGVLKTLPDEFRRAA